MFKLYNTLTSRVEEFQPITPPEVRMYVCGPTVYDYAHIGNFRTFLFVDLLRRYIKHKGYQLRHVMNITDVDDKIIARAIESKKSLREFTDQYIQFFFEDFDALGPSGRKRFCARPITYRRWLKSSNSWARTITHTNPMARP